MGWAIRVCLIRQERYRTGVETQWWSGLNFNILSCFVHVYSMLFHIYLFIYLFM